MAVDEKTMAMDVARWIPEDDSARLGSYDGASTDAIEATLALHPLDTRNMLAKTGVLTDASSAFALTNFGQEVLNACSVIAPDLGQEQ
jgi:hypothetical protein